MLLDSDDPALAQQALDHYREHYVEIGLFENQLYDGIREILAEFSGQGQRLYVATAKPETFARRVITYFELDEFFSDIYGPTLEGLRNDKRDLLGYLMAKTDLVPASAVMIGDRKHDIQAALAHGITSIGVCYGFGSPAELSAAGCDYLVDNVTDLHQLLRRLCPRAIPERNRSDLQD